MLGTVATPLPGACGWAHVLALAQGYPWPEKGLSKASQHLATPRLGLIKSAGPVRFLVLGTGIEELNTQPEAGTKGRGHGEGSQSQPKALTGRSDEGSGQAGVRATDRAHREDPQGEARAPQVDGGLWVSEAVQQPGSGPAPVTDSVRAPNSTVLILVAGLLR